METLKKCAPSFPCLQSCVQVLRVCEQSGVNSFICKHLFSKRTTVLLLFFALSVFPRSNRRKNYPGCPSHLSGELFPRVETLPSFFSPLSPLSPFYQCQMITWGETELGNNMRQVGQGAPGQKHLLLLLLLPAPATRPSLHPSDSPQMPSHHPSRPRSPPLCQPRAVAEPQAHLGGISLLKFISISEASSFVHSV